MIEQVFRYNFVPTTRGVYYLPARESDAGVPVRFLDFKTGAVTDVVMLDKPADLGLTVSPDGRHLLFTKMDYVGTDLMLVENFR